MIKIILLLLCLNFNAAANIWDADNYAKTKIITGKYQEDALIGVYFKLKPGWKIYDNTENDIGFPTTAKFLNQNNILNTQIFYPKSEKFNEAGGFTTYGYQNEVILPIKITPNDKNNIISSQIQLDYALCKEICIPVSKKIPLSIEANSLDKNNLKLIEKYRQTDSLWWLFFSAFLAGLILNFMPCVLPVLFLKIFSFLEKRNTNPQEIILASLSTIAGIITIFLLLSFSVILLKILGHNVGWGVHFQEPIFIAILTLIILIFAANIFGIFQIRIPQFLSNKLNKAANKEGKLKHFLTGMLVTILATPCSAPFLGPAIAFALTSSYVNIILIFLTISLGLSLPYIILIIKPNLLYLLPKPGSWMNKFKNLMGIFLIITAIWLLSILKNQLFSTENFDDYAKDYKKVNISQMIEENKIIFVNITADWCLTCKFNEKFVLNRNAMREFFTENNIIVLKADYTNYDPQIKALLESKNRYAIPTYIIYSKENPKGILLSEILTIQKVKNALNDVQNSN